MKLRLSGSLLVLCLWTHIAPALQAPDPEALLSFAAYLGQKEQFDKALVEYERFLFFHPQRTEAPIARIQIGACQARLSQWDEAERTWEKVKQDYPDSTWSDLATLLQAEADYRHHRYPRSTARIARFRTEHPDSPLIDLATILLARNEMPFDNTRYADDILRTVNTNSPLNPVATGFRESLEAFPGRPTKSPLLAGSLSALLPGAGQLYTGHRSDAATAFILNGLFIGGAVWAYHEDEPVTGALLIGFDAIWYFGNIYNAVNHAHQFNQQGRDDFANRLQLRFGATLDGSVRDRGGRDLVPALLMRFEF
jgi:tetratricopeptide (TPR) repeat protein